jgi:hypothetical protein
MSLPQGLKSLAAGGRCAVALGRPAAFAIVRQLQRPRCLGGPPASSKARPILAADNPRLGPRRRASSSPSSPCAAKRRHQELTVSRDTPASAAITSAPGSQHDPGRQRFQTAAAWLPKRITTALICKDYLRDTPLADKHRLSGHRENVKSGRNQATGTRQFVVMYQPARTKLSNTILRPALSKSTVSLLPSTVATVPVPNFA